jgi:thiamine pyrophosphate-dependent acetolactate synthase large subunit-like protein
LIPRRACSTLSAHARELRSCRVLVEDAVVIGDGGDFVSYAGKYNEPKRPSGWLEPGPYSCLVVVLGYAIAARIARPSAQVVLLLGDGAAGFSLTDASTPVRHQLPVVMICSNNGIWGLKKHPMHVHVGVHRPGRDHVGGDVARLELPGRAGQPDHAGSGRRVVGQPA